jgi:hypothetical protein
VKRYKSTRRRLNPKAVPAGSDIPARLLGYADEVIEIRLPTPAIAHQRSGDSLIEVRFSNWPFEVKHFQTVHYCNVDVAHGLVLLSGIGTRALPPWDSRTR